MERVDKVIKGLQEAVDWLSTETSLTVVDQWVVRDALALLKAQKPVKPKLIGIYYVCGQCGMRIVGQRKTQTNDMLKVSNYCPDCGQAVKWK